MCLQYKTLFSLIYELYTRIINILILRAYKEHSFQFIFEIQVLLTLTVTFLTNWLLPLCTQR